MCVCVCVRARVHSSAHVHVSFSSAAYDTFGNQEILYTFISSFTWNFINITIKSYYSLIQPLWLTCNIIQQNMKEIQGTKHTLMQI